jgi:hypothetical protein
MAFDITLRSSTGFDVQFGSPPPSSNVIEIFNGTVWVDASVEMFNGSIWVATDLEMHDGTIWA